MLSKDLPEAVLGDVEREVSDPEGGGRGVGGSVGLVLLLLLTRGSDGGVVDSGLSAVDRLGRVVSLGGGLLVGELDVSDSSRSAGLSVHLDSGRGHLSELGELGREPLLVDVPREVSNPKGGGGGVALSGPSLGLVDLGLLGLNGRLLLGLSLAW